MDPPVIDPVAALNTLNKLINEEDDPELKAELRKPAPKHEKRLVGLVHDKSIERPSYEDEAAKLLREPTPSVTEAESRIDLPSQDEVDSILASDQALSDKDVKFLIRSVFRTMELHQVYVEEMVANVNAAIESLNRKAEFLQVPGPTQKVPVKQDKPLPFDVSSTDLTKYLLDPPPTIKVTRSRLKEIVSKVQGEWIDNSEVSNLSREQLDGVMKDWTEKTVVKLLSKH